MIKSRAAKYRGVKVLTKTQIDLIAAVAKRLAGKNIIIRQREPATVGVWGEAHKTENGECVIDLSPNIPNGKLLFIVLHEIAHHARQSFLPTAVYKAMPATLSQNKRTVGNAIMENAADKQAAEWLEWANKHADARLKQAAEFEAALIALLDYAK